MIFQIPTKDTRRFIQPNRGDLAGNIFATWNMDFDSVLGRARVSPTVRINTDDGDDAQLGIPLAFVRSSADTTDRWWALCGTVLFKAAGTDPTGAFTQDAITSTPTTATIISSDMVDFNGKLYVSLPTEITELEAGTWDADWWTNVIGGTAPTTGIAHPIHVSIKRNLFIVGDGNLIHVMDKNENVSNSRVILPSEFETIWIRSNQNGTWIGARNKENGEAEAFFWDEVSENYNYSYKLKSDRTFAGVIKDGIPYTINGEGQLLAYAGGEGFVEMAVLPIFQADFWEDGNTVNRCVHRNGMAVIDEKIHILASTTISNDDTRFISNFPAGIWTFDENSGLRHKHSLSQYDGTEIDYGAMVLDNVGALVPTGAESKFLAGGQIRTNSATEREAIFYMDDGRTNKRGHFITSLFESSAFEDIFQDLLLNFKRFINSSDRIIVKYRSVKNVNYPIVAATCTWASTTTFTLTAVQVGTITNIAAGNEVMIKNGKGAGGTFNIKSVAEAGGTYTITIDEAVAAGVASGTFSCEINNWTVCATVSTQSIERQEFDLDVPGTWLQLKVELRSVPGGTFAKRNSPELELLRVRSQGDAVI